MKTTGQIIKELRKAKGLTQEQLGELIGVQKSAIAKYENDRIPNLKRQTIEKMAELFNVRPSYIMGFTEDSNMEAINRHNETQAVINAYWAADYRTQKAVRIMLGIEE
jgi:transcriptional regulator with XRE-family HTH domain